MEIYKIYLLRLVEWKYVKYMFIKVGWMEIFKIYLLRLVGWKWMEYI